MPFDAPFRLGPFVVDRLGRLQPNALQASPSVHVRWRSLWVTVTLEAADSSELNGRLLLTAPIARVRSTAVAGPGHRAQALDMLRELAVSMPSGWRLRLLADHSARIDAANPVSLPATATELLTVVTCFLLDLAPYLDLMEEPEAGFESMGGMPVSTAGMANTCPG